VALCSLRFPLLTPTKKISCLDASSNANSGSPVLLNGNSEYHYSLFPAATGLGSAGAWLVGAFRALGVSRLNCRILYSSAL